MTKKEFMILTGKSRGQVDKLIRKGRFMVNGFGWFVSSKTGESKTAPIEITKVIDQPKNKAGENKNSDDINKNSEAVPVGAVAAVAGGFMPAGVAAGESMSKLKMAKMSVEIKRMQQQIDETRENIEKKYEEKVIEKLLSCLICVKKSFAKCKLNKEQTIIINRAFEQGLRSIKPKEARDDKEN
jgi:hypothetical protein